MSTHRAKPFDWAREHRKREREHLKSVRYYLRRGMYNEAFRSLAYVLEQSSAADAIESERRRVKEQMQ